jgi:ABC-type glycerol-3-phosphate transport system permease component
MSTTPYPIDPFGQRNKALETVAAWALGLLWLLPLVYAVWTAFHPAQFATRFELTAPLTLQNFVNAWEAAPFPRYFLNTFALVSMILVAQLLLSTLAAYAFARFRFRGSDFVFMLVLMQLMVMPDILIVENYNTMNKLGLRDTILAIGLPYFASASASSCCARPSSRCRANWTRRPRWKAPAPCRCCGRSTFRWPSRSTWPLRWYPSAPTGTTSCGH